MKWQEWKLLQLEERQEHEEPRIEVVTEREATEPEQERDPDRELVHA